MTVSERSHRLASRFLAGLPAVLHVGGANYVCAAYNLSRKGVLLVGDFPPTGEPEIRVTLRSGRGDLQMSANARVVRREDDPAGEENQIGVEFVEIADADRPALESLVSRVIEGIAPAVIESLPANPHSGQIRHALEKVSLAHRIVLASRGMPRERELLIHDPQPQVIDALARNPNLLRPEVQTLLRMPGLLPNTLETIARDSKWSSDETLMVAVATHPNVPLALADRLVTGFSAQGKQRALQSAGLKAALREKLLKKGRGRKR